MAKENIRKFRVIGVPWHVAHQHTLCQLSFIERYDLLINPYRTWGAKSRPFPEKMKWVDYYKKGEYDFAILHVDQQCLADRIGKGLLYKQVNNLIQDIPKIVINHNHMTPYHDKYTYEETVQRMKELVGNNFMIVNSHTARDQWGWGKTVVHGMKVDEWWDNPKEPRATCFVSSAGMEKAYRREVLRNTIQLLSEWGHRFYWIGIDVKFNSFNEYREWLSRSLVYLNLTFQSPMPRSRTEAMLSGACVVTGKHQDADMFIKDGENGFLVGDDPVEIATLVSRLLTVDTKKALKVGKRGREFAREYFKFENFEKQWESVLREVGVWK